MMRSPLVIMTLCVLLVAVLPMAASAKMMPVNYGVLKLGGYFPQASDVDDFKSGFNGEVAFGHYVAPGFAFELGAGYFKTSDSEFPSGALKVDKKISVTPVTLTLKGLYPAGEFEPFAEVGIGVYFAKAELPGRSERDAAVGFHLGAGANYNVTSRLFLGIEGKYFILKISTFDVDTRMDGITLTGNIGYRF